MPKEVGSSNKRGRPPLNKDGNNNSSQKEGEELKEDYPVLIITSSPQSPTEKQSPTKISEQVLVDSETRYVGGGPNAVDMEEKRKSGSELRQMRVNLHALDVNTASQNVCQENEKAIPAKRPRGRPPKISKQKYSGGRRPGRPRKSV